MRVPLRLLRKTKNFLRYIEVDEKGRAVFDFKADSGTISDIYIRKDAFGGVVPEAIWITIESVK